jgi:hypothetical protein
MMRKSDMRYWLTAMLLAAQAVLLVPASAGEAPDTGASSAALIVMHRDGTNTGKFTREAPACRRYGVIWSGGIALRRPDRISPRPVRSRWQGAGENRIRCKDGGAFRQPQVADSPWIR